METPVIAGIVLRGISRTKLQILMIIQESKTIPGIIHFHELPIESISLLCR
jgi:hypothetical protein